MADYYCDKDEIVKLLRELGHRVIDVPGLHSEYGTIIVVLGDSEEIIRYQSAGTLM